MDCPPSGRVWFRTVPAWSVRVEGRRSEARPADEPSETDAMRRVVAFASMRRRHDALFRILVSSVLGALLVQCTLLNPLDHLQSDRGKPDGESAPTDDAMPSTDGGTLGDESVTADGAVAPGCPPESWSDCNAVATATALHPGGVTFGLQPESVFFTDVATGEVWELNCPAGACGAPKLVVAGENAPRGIVAMNGVLYWTTADKVRSFRYAVPDDASTGPANDFAPLSGPADIAATYPIVVWTDDDGVRGALQSGSVATIASTRATSPLVESNGKVVFVTGGVVKACVWSIGLGGCESAPADVPGIAGATTLASGRLLAFGPFGSELPVVASVPSADGGTDIVVSDHDDAGSPLVLAHENAEVRALGSNATHIYWTTANGELRQRAAKSTLVRTLIRGLSEDTDIAVAQDTVMIADRAGGRIVRVTP